jgi:hypothetical protein
VKRHRLIRLIATVSVISFALVTLIGLVSRPGSPPAIFAEFMIRIVAVIGAAAVLVGVLNLLSVHWGRIRSTRHGWPYSLITLLAAIAVIALRILDRADIWPDDLKGEQMSVRVFESVQVTLESALAALALFFLVYAAYRLMRRRVTWGYLMFSLTAIVVLLGWIPLKDLDVLADVREWVVRVPVSAGARGLLIGVGLGTVVAGVRVLIGQDRSFRGS